MNIVRLALVVIVAYILGLGTGLVGGVVFSFREFAVPANSSTAATGDQDVASLGQGGQGSSPASSPLTSSSASSSSSSSSPAPLSASPAPSSPSAPVSSATPDAAGASPGAGQDTSASQPVASSAPSSEPSVGPVPSPVTIHTAPSPAPSRVAAAHHVGKATLLVTANKGNGFAVYIDGTKRGVTPCKVEVKSDVTHNVKVAGGDKFKSWQVGIKPAANEQRIVKALLVYIPPAPPPPPAPRYHPYVPPAQPRYVPNNGGGRPVVTGNTRW